MMILFSLSIIVGMVVICYLCYVIGRIAYEFGAITNSIDQMAHKIEAFEVKNSKDSYSETVNTMHFVGYPNCN